MSRDPERIDYVLDCIKTIWQKNPDLRLGQLLMNTGMNFNNFYYIEDKVLLQYLSKLYKTKLLSESEYQDYHELINSSAEKVIEEKPQEELVVKSTNRGRVYVHRGEEVRSIYKEELDDYLSIGFKIGKKDRK